MTGDPITVKVRNLVNRPIARAYGDKVLNTRRVECDPAEVCGCSHHSLNHRDGGYECQECGCLGWHPAEPCVVCPECAGRWDEIDARCKSCGLTIEDLMMIAIARDAEVSR